jgi:hypothetical protein
VHSQGLPRAVIRGVGEKITHGITILPPPPGQNASCLPDFLSAF